MPKKCHSPAIVDMRVKLNDRTIDNAYFYDKGHESILIENARSGTYRITV
jgi:hypothetical protein